MYKDSAPASTSSEVEGPDVRTELGARQPHEPRSPPQKVYPLHPLVVLLVCGLFRGRASASGVERN